MNDEINEKYGVSYDVRENLLKAQIILKKSWISISAARASISQTDKTFLCDKNYVNIIELLIKKNKKIFNANFIRMKIMMIQIWKYQLKRQLI